MTDAGAADRFRPLRIWKSMDRERRVRAAESFWKSEVVQGPERDAVTIALAQSLHFRPQSVRSASAGQRASWLAGFQGLNDQIAANLLYAYHMERQVPMMSAFLDAVGVAHENGKISEKLTPPTREQVEKGVDALLAAFDRGDVVIYLETLAGQDEENWAAIPPVLAERGM